MGSFFTNVQVRAGRARDLAPLLDALRGEAREAGMDEVGDDGAPDRVVCVLAPDAHGWVAVYDQATESQDSLRLRALAGVVSRALDAPAFAVMVHDSDVLELTLFDHGEEVDRFDSAPDYFGGKPSKAARARVAGQPERWQPLLLAGRTASALRAVWHAEDLMAERTLVRTCELIGCDPQRASVGYRHATEDGFPGDAATLRFRARVRPAHEAPVGGPPAFRPYAPPDRASAQLAVGDELRLGVTVQSAGGASTGLSIVLWGDALDAQLVVPATLELVVGDPLEGGRFTKHPLVALSQIEGDALYAVDLPEQAIPAGLPDLETGFPPGADVDATMAAMLATNLHVNVVGRVERAGRGSLSVVFEPHVNTDEGSSGAVYDLTIDPPLPRPLRVRSETGGGASSDVLRPLVGTRYLVALVAIDAGRARAAASARAAIDAALEIVGTHGNVQTTHFRAAPQRPKMGRGKVATALRGKRLATLIEAMATSPVVDLAVRDGADFDPETGPLPAKWGVTFGTDLLGGRDAERVPTLVMWADTEALGAEPAAALEARWTAVVARAMARDGVQGVVLRGGWSGGGLIEHTGYETACGTGGTITTARTWLTRWVRVPGNQCLWLGPALAARLGDDARAKLAPLADTAQEGAALCLTLRRPGDAHAFEEALAAILPSERNAADATRAWYDRARG